MNIVVLNDLMTTLNILKLKQNIMETMNVVTLKKNMIILTLIIQKNIQPNVEEDEDWRNDIKMKMLRYSHLGMLHMKHGTIQDL